MTTERIDLDVNLSANDRDLDRLVGKLEDVSGEVLALGKNVQAIARGMDNLAKGISGVSAKPIQNAVRATNELANAQQRAAKTAAAMKIAQGEARYQSLRSMGITLDPKDTKGTEVSGANLHYLRQELQARNGVTQEMSRQAALQRTMLGNQQQMNRLADIQQKFGNQAASSAALGRVTGTGMGSAQAVASRMLADASRLEGNELKFLEGQRSAAQRSVGQLESQYARLLGPQRAVVAHLREEEAVTDRLTNARYAMFAAGATLAAGSAALGFAMLQTVRSAMEYETALAQISRTSDMTGRSLESFAGTLRGLSGSIPTPFEDISEIATLGGQLNVPQERLEDFTRTVAQFGMTTNVSAEVSAEAFGRLDALLGDVQGQYDRLGSSILHVGVNAVATESDIIATAVSIAAVTAQAGFAAKETIGFAAAMRSLGIQPELARGGLTRVFGLISDAIASGGAALDTFAGLSGRTAEQFRSDWRDNAASTFMDLMEGMEGARNSGQDLYQVMNQLGIVNSRDRQVVAVLSQNYDELRSAVGYASEGFEDGTQLQEAFGIQAETLASKLQMLMNSLHAMFAVLAQPALAPFGAIADTLAAVAKGITDVVSQSGPLQTVIGLVGGALTVLAGFGLITGTLTLFVAASIAARTAMRTVHTEMEIARLKIMEQNAALMVNNSAQAGNVAAISRRIAAQKALIATLGGTAAAERAAAVSASANTVAISAANAAAVTGVSKWAAYREVLLFSTTATSRFGRALSGVSALAGGPVGIAIMGIATALAAVDAAQRSVNHSTEEWHALLKSTPSAENIFNFADAESLPGADDMFGLMPSTNFDFMRDIERLPFLLERSAAMSRNWWETWNAGANVGAHGLGELVTNLDRIDQNLAGMDFSVIQTVFQSMVDGANLSDEAAGNLLATMGSVRDAAIEYASANEIMITTAQGTVDESALLAMVMQDVAVASADAGMIGSEAMYYLADSAGVAADETQRVSDVLAQEFGVANATVALGDALRVFAEGIIAGGESFNVLSASGAVNVGNLISLFDAAIVAAQAHGGSAADAVNQVFAALAANGLNTLAILNALRAASVTSIGGVNLDSITNGARAANSQATGLATTMRSVLSNGLDRARAAASRTGRSLGGGGRRSGGGGGRRAGGTGARPDSVAGGAAAAAAEIRTLVDYTNDLKKVFSRAFELRFGSSQAQDKIAEGWMKIAEATADATEAIASANREMDETRAKMQTLHADRAIQEYFLTIAEAYEDSLRAGELRARLAEIDSELASNNNDLTKSEQERADAEAILRKELTGNSKAAIENRATIIGLASSYQDYLLALAAAGTPQAELQRKAAEMKNEFMAQGVAAGFSASELNTYAAAFDDMATIIGRVPYNVTVGFNGDPALQALAEFEAELAERAERAGRAAGRSLGSGLSGGLGGLGGGIGGAIGDALGGLDWDELLGDTFDDLLDSLVPPKKGLTPRKNEKSGAWQQHDEEGNWVRPNGRQIIPDEPTGPVLTGGLEPEPGFWDHFWEELTNPSPGVLDTPQLTTSIGVPMAEAILRGLVPSTEKGIRKLPVSLKRAISTGNWNETGVDIGVRVGQGTQTGAIKSRVGEAFSKNIRDTDWNGAGTASGGKLSLGLKMAYKGARVDDFTLRAIDENQWRTKGDGTGRTLGESLKYGYGSTRPSDTMINNLKSGDWTGSGINSGNKFGGGIKRGVSDERTAENILNASSGGDWYGRGHGQGKNVAIGVRDGSLYVNPAASLKASFDNATWYGSGKAIGYNVSSGIKAGFNETSPTVNTGSGGSVKMYAYRQGGYTGGGGRDDLAGFVHGQEYVMPAEAVQKIGLNALNYMRATGSVPASSSVPNGMTVMAELSPTDRALLARAGDVRLELTGGGIASVTGSANVTAVRRGGN